MLLEDVKWIQNETSASRNGVSWGPNACATSPKFQKYVKKPQCQICLNLRGSLLHWLPLAYPAVGQTARPGSLWVSRL